MYVCVCVGGSWGGVPCSGMTNYDGSFPHAVGNPSGKPDTLRRGGKKTASKPGPGKLQYGEEFGGKLSVSIARTRIAKKKSVRRGAFTRV